MAICLINQTILSAGRGERVVGLAAYICRERWQDPITGQIYDFSVHAGDVLHSEVLLPEGANSDLANRQALIAAMEEAERITIKKTGQRRFRINAQLAKHIILALPKELTAKQRIALAREWALTQYVPHGAGVLLVIHEADDPETSNVHAHLLVTTRAVEKEGLSKHKARHLDPAFSRGKGHEKGTLHKDDLPGQWRDFQNAFFRKHDIPLSVDPSFLVSGLHQGKARFVPGSDLGATNEAARAEARQRIRQIPDLLEYVTRHAATFTRSTLKAALRKHDVPTEEIAGIVDKAVADSEVIPLIDLVSGKTGKLFTTRAVRAQEQRILALARGLKGKRVPERHRKYLTTAGKYFARRLGLSTEQKEALLHCVAGARISCVRGVAGAGKSYTVTGIRETLEACGYRVVGLAPTNKVVCSMKADGFGYAATLHLESLRQKSERYANQRWDENTCVIVDEAGMVDSAMLEELLARAMATGAKLILVGDQAQLSSVSRGGMFGVLKDKLGCAEIKEIRRQTEDWARAASLDFAEGDIGVGLSAYDERGHLRWSKTLDDATAALVRQWRKDFQAAPGVERFVYAATNASVDRLNDALQAVRWESDAPDFVTFETKRGPIRLAAGDRFQVFGNHRKNDIFNGMVGTVTEATPHRITFQVDGGRELSFDPEDFQDFGLGYAGTVYRGQGQTLPRTYALYDCKFSWNRRTTYVALTRHKNAVSLFVPRELAANTKTLALQMARDDDNEPSICHEAAEDQHRHATAAAKTSGKTNDSAPPPVNPEGQDTPEAMDTSAPLASSRPFNTSIGGTSVSYDLAVLSQRVSLTNDLTAATPGDIAAAYKSLKQHNSEEEAIRDTLIRIASTAKRRGLSAVTGKTHLDPFSDLRDKNEPLHSNPILAPDPGSGEPDIRPFLQHANDFSIEKARSARRTIKRFHVDACKEVWKSLWRAKDRADFDDRLRYPIVVAIGFLQSWLWRTNDRPVWLPALTPGDYRRNYLSLFPKARTEFRAFDAPPEEEPQIARSAATSAAIQPPASPQPSPATESSWKAEQRLKKEREEKRQKLEDDLTYVNLKLKAATGDDRISLKTIQAGLMLALDNIDRGFDQTTSRLSVDTCSGPTSYQRIDPAGELPDEQANASPSLTNTQKQLDRHPNSGSHAINGPRSQREMGSER